MIIETTDGDVYITIDMCDCNSTSGCEKCQTKIIPKVVYEKMEQGGSLWDIVVSAINLRT